MWINCFDTDALPLFSQANRNDKPQTRIAHHIRRQLRCEDHVTKIDEHYNTFAKFEYFIKSIRYFCSQVKICTTNHLF